MKRLVLIFTACAIVLGTAGVAEAGLWKSVKRGFWKVAKAGVGVKIDDKGVRPHVGKPKGIK